jgi:hypothetical protein
MWSCICACVFQVPVHPLLPVLLLQLLSEVRPDARCIERHTSAHRALCIILKRQVFCKWRGLPSNLKVTPAASVSRETGAEWHIVAFSPTYAVPFPQRISVHFINSRTSLNYLELLKVRSSLFWPRDGASSSIKYCVDANSVQVNVTNYWVLLEMHHNHFF